MQISSQHNPAYPIRQIPLSRPFVWLGLAWQDLMHHRSASLAYGLIISLMGMVLLAYDRHPYFVAMAIAGFLLLGPIMAAGLCELSRCSDQHEETSFDASLRALRRNRENLMGVANRLLLFCVAWFALSYFAIQAVLGDVAPTMGETAGGDVLFRISDEQLAAYILSSGGLAILVFVASVVTIPMIIEHHVHAGNAIRTSLRVVSKNFPAILVWAVIIATLSIVGFATFLVGMIVIFPLLGHATWYAYRDLVEQ